MTDTEIKLVLQELHGAGLANEPKDPTATIAIWRDFFGGEDSRVIGKAVWIHLRNSHFWPTPSDLLKYMQRAVWLVEMEDEKLAEQKKLNALGGEPHTDISLIKQKTKQPPRAPAIRIESRKCELHIGECILLDDLCDGPVDGKCPFEGI